MGPLQFIFADVPTKLLDKMPPHSTILQLRRSHLHACSLAYEKLLTVHPHVLLSTAHVPIAPFPW